MGLSQAYIPSPFLSFATDKYSFFLACTGRGLHILETHSPISAILSHARPCCHTRTSPQALSSCFYQHLPCHSAHFWQRRQLLQNSLGGKCLLMPSLPNGPSRPAPCCVSDLILPDLVASESSTRVEISALKDIFVSSPWVFTDSIKAVWPEPEHKCSWQHYM